MNKLILILLIIPLLGSGTAWGNAVDNNIYDFFQHDQNVCIVLGNLTLGIEYKLERLGTSGIDSSTLASTKIFEGELSSADSLHETESLFVFTDFCVPEGDNAYHLSRKSSSSGAQWVLMHEKTLTVTEPGIECDEDEQGNPCEDLTDPEDYDLGTDDEDSTDDDEDDEGCGCSTNGGSSALSSLAMLLIGLSAYLVSRKKSPFQK